MAQNFLNKLLGSEWVDLTDGLDVNPEVYSDGNCKCEPIG